MRAAYEANGWADLDDDLKPLTKRPRVEITVDNDSSDKSDGEDVYRDFDI